MSLSLTKVFLHVKFRLILPCCWKCLLSPFVLPSYSVNCHLFSMLHLLGIILISSSELLPGYHHPFYHHYMSHLFPHFLSDYLLNFLSYVFQERLFCQTSLLNRYLFQRVTHIFALLLSMDYMSSFVQPF